MVRYVRVLRWGVHLVVIVALLAALYRLGLSHMWTMGQPGLSDELSGEIVGMYKMVGTPVAVALGLQVLVVILDAAASFKGRR